MDNEIKALLAVHADDIKKQIDASYKDTAKCFMESVMPQFESRMYEISKEVATKTAEQVCMELTGENYCMPERRRIVREGVQWAIKTSAKNTIAVTTIITGAISSIFTIAAGMAIYFLKG